MVADPQILAFQRRLAEVHQAAAARRTAAFVDYAPLVCGLALQPLTLRTYTLLLAWRNAFVCGGTVALKDIVQFVWVHQPEFGQFAHGPRRRLTRRVWRALHPRLPTLNTVIRFLAPLPRFRWLRPLCRRTAAERHALAIAEIRRLVAEALADFPPPTADSPPAVCALTPQFVALLVRGYACDFDTARRLVAALPLAQLMQYLREILHRLSQGRDKLITPEEAAVWADYLGYKTEQARARS